MELSCSSQRMGRRKKTSSLRKKQQKAAERLPAHRRTDDGLARSKRTSQSPIAVRLLRLRPAARVQDHVHGSRTVRPVGVRPECRTGRAGSSHSPQGQDPAAAASRGRRCRVGQEAATSGSGRWATRCPLRGEHPRVWTGSCYCHLWPWAPVARHRRPRTGVCCVIVFQNLNWPCRPALHVLRSI